MSQLSSERATVQDPLLRYATEVGWTYLPPDEALRLRRGESSPLLWEVFIKKVQELNAGAVDHLKAEEEGKRLVRVAPTAEGNLQAWEFLKGLKTIYVEAERRERNLRLLDFEYVHRNAFHVTDEFTFTNGVNHIRADVVFLINGIPIILIETKAATKLQGMAEALEQVRRYHREGSELLQIFGLTHLVQYYYGAPFAIFWLLKQNEAPMEKAEGVATEMTKVFENYPHLRTSERQGREVRRELYSRLGKLGVKNVPELVERIMKVIQRENKKGK